MSGGDPLFGTLVALPLLVAAFGAFERWVVRRGGCPLAVAGSAGELLASGLWALLALARPHLGLPPSGAEILFGALPVLLASLDRLDPAPDDRRERGEAALA